MRNTDYATANISTAAFATYHDTKHGIRSRRHFSAAILSLSISFSSYCFDWHHLDAVLFCDVQYLSCPSNRASPLLYWPPYKNCIPVDRKGL